MQGTELFVAAANRVEAPMSNTDFVIDDAAVHFAASKNSDYRTRVELRFRVFIKFLQLNDSDHPSGRPASH